MDGLLISSCKDSSPKLMGHKILDWPSDKWTRKDETKEKRANSLDVVGSAFFLLFWCFCHHDAFELAQKIVKNGKRPDARHGTYQVFWFPSAPAFPIVSTIATQSILSCKQKYRAMWNGLSLKMDLHTTRAACARLLDRKNEGKKIYWPPTSNGMVTKSTCMPYEDLFCHPFYPGAMGGDWIWKKQKQQYNQRRK